MSLFTPKYFPFPQPISATTAPGRCPPKKSATLGQARWRVSLKWSAMSSYTECTWRRSRRAASVSVWGIDKSVSVTGGGGGRGLVGLLEEYFRKFNCELQLYIWYGRCQYSWMDLAPHSIVKCELYAKCMLGTITCVRFNYSNTLMGDCNFMCQF